MMVFKACMGVLLGIAFTLNITTAYYNRNGDKLDFWTAAVLTIVAAYEAYVVYRTTNYISTGFTCGIIFACAIYLTIFELWYHHRTHRIKQMIKINKLKSQNDLLKNQVKTMRMMRRDFIKDHYK